MTNLQTRILTALIGVPIVLWILYLGGIPVTLFVALLALLAQREFYKMVRAGGQAVFPVWGSVGTLLIFAKCLYPALPMIWPLWGLVLVLHAVFRNSVEDVWKGIAWTVTGIFYPSLCFYYLLLVRLDFINVLGESASFYLTLLILLMIWSMDSMAYFAGKNFGKRPLAPMISPKKTWEGAIGGGLGAILAGVLFKLTLLSQLTWVDISVLALCCGVLGQVGDLLESALKRSVGVKDSGTILPGHGGILDRVDALILAAPLCYFYLSWVY